MMLVGDPDDPKTLFRMIDVNGRFRLTPDRVDNLKGLIDRLLKKVQPDSVEDVPEVPVSPKDASESEARSTKRPGPLDTPTSPRQKR
jgi:hypothetical protein